MNNFIKCPNCDTDNPNYSVSCSNCNAYIRDKTANIDFWETIWKMLYSPVSAAKSIIYAEHKNFTIIFLFLIILKLFLLKLSFVYIFNETSNFADNFLINFSTFILITAVSLTIISFSLVHISKYLKWETRFMDNFALLVFSFSPLLISLLVFTPVEYALFGSYWFTSNPLPILVKPIPAIMLYSLEMVMVVWSIIIYSNAIFAQSNSRIFSFIAGIAAYIIIFGSLIYLI